MVFLLKTKTSKKDVPIDRLPFMISEKTDCLGSRFFRITTYYLLPLHISVCSAIAHFTLSCTFHFALPLRISFPMLSTCCPCAFRSIGHLLPIPAAYRAHRLPHSRITYISQPSDIS